ncbi:receptor-like serine/threonine-protein kinase ALE2 isoform X2 [Mangifera indica]|uniref:receptor-like serine/threonine-protein kinase ALE2 isoform X2 n=1 Tax=Mangifera indica TaxID=29780 RepID=UPI001CFA3F00|nr:receptor-like serine/threonine-protein kinase ALE2 isoform X2 [Mangifera indica]
MFTELLTFALPPRRLPQNSFPVHSVRPGQAPLMPQDHTFPPKVSPSNYGRKRHGEMHAPSKKAYHISSPVDYSPSIGNLKSGHSHHSIRPSSIALAPSMPSFRDPPKKWLHGPASGPSYFIPSATNRWQGPSISPFHSPFALAPSWSSHAPAASEIIPSGHFSMPFLQPTVSPMSSFYKKKKAPSPSIVMTLPPPPPNGDCAMVTCTEPLTYTPPGSACGCVRPIQVKLRLGIAIYTFFPLVSELAEEIAASVGLNHSQVRIMGANAASQQLEKSTVLINLVPRGVKFKDTTAFSIYRKFWKRQMSIKASLFGPYEVLYVRYPGLPPSPPLAQSDISSTNDGPYDSGDNSGQAIKPLGVDIPRRKKGGLSRSMIVVIVLSSFTAFVLCCGIAWLLLLKCGASKQNPHAFISSPSKPSGALESRKYRSMLSSSSMSFNSSTVTYTGSAKTFSFNDIERATDCFDHSKVLGEGGFGVVYRGILDDGREVAVKVLKRDDQHGGREFLAEIEMLGRLHHRNLVKLIGICIEDHTRCLVYELVHNGSVESHLHGVDKVNGKLDWDARMKIALGAARGLAYLHEDSSPRVIHRDFKSSNILLEHDFTPKVSDFGLARAALDEGNKHISTHVMGTFGYLAPEYAMTGHLLVKSDVYSYGVVLLELLTGRKPVDLSQPPGQENLVVWARPLLTSKEGLDIIIDPFIKSDISYDSIAKVAAIASMCVQPEVSHRPFMGEVVQALKLVCNEFNETKEIGSKGLGEDFSINVDSKMNRLSGKLSEVSEACQMPSGFGIGRDNNVAISASELLSMPLGPERQNSGSFRRHSISGPLRTSGRHFWQRLKGLSRGSMSEHAFSSKFLQRSH